MELDEEAARIAISMTENIEYSKLASRITISNLHKSTHECFSEVMELLWNNTDKNNKHSPILADDIIEIIRQNKNTFNFAIDYSRDYNFDYFGFKTLEKSYLMKIFDKDLNKMKVVERPQHLYMRVSIGIHKNDIENVLKTYNLISQHMYTHASPTMFNAGSRLANLSSCFLIGTDDHIEGIFKTITDCGKISKVGGGIGVHISNIRAKGSIIRGTNGTSDGIIPMLKVYNETCKYINQSGKRKGSFAMYIEPWHADILEFLDLKKNQGHEDVRARDLFYALWIPDLFMKQVENDGDWYLMCPDECPGLPDTYGEKFEELYNKYVEQKKYKKVVKAQEIWRKMMDSQIETGVPYIGFKDAVNKKCNQKNLGTIKSSNLCLEISLYSDHENYAVCNLASLALPKYVEYDENNIPIFNHQKLKDVAEHVILAMNKVIDNNYYPTPETSKTNFENRPLGIGVQGLSDVYIKMRMPFDSPEAKELNKEIFETLYYGCLKGSLEEAKRDGPYKTFKRSPFSEGKLQFDLAAEFDGIDLNNYLSGRWDWDSLKQDIKKYGVRNSMLTALMPTAGSSQLMNNSECFEPIDSCIFKRRTLSGEYMVVNKYLVNELTKLGLWSKELKEKIIAMDGSIQNIDEIPDTIKKIYKTVWETSMKAVIEQAGDRQVFVDQMQSMNLFMSTPNYKKLSSMLFYSWKNHLKSGMYYLRSKGAYQAGKFSIDASLEKSIRDKISKGVETTKEEEKLICSIDNKEDCMACSS
jgi:ribonucleoside-diphosphate reductase alpha chain